MGARLCKAAVFRDPGKPISVEQITVAAPRRTEVTIKVAACGVCHTDLSAMNGTLPIPPPLVLGHELSGVVVEVGEGVTDLAVGDHVVGSFTANCGKCDFCCVGRPQLCTEGAKTTVTARDGTYVLNDGEGNPLGRFIGLGGMAEYATIDRETAIKIDPSIPLEVAALVGCAVTTGVGAVINTAKVEPGSTVAIFGAGGVGIAAVQGAVLSGALKIIVVDMSDERLNTAQKFGATHVINARNEDPVSKIQELTNGGANYAFECIGLPATVEQAFLCVGRGGKAVVVGVTKFTDTITIPSVVFSLEERTLTGSLYGSARVQVDFPRLLGLYQRGLLRLDEMITSRYSIDDVNRAFTDLIATKNTRGIIVF